MNAQATATGPEEQSIPLIRGIHALLKECEAASLIQVQPTTLANWRATKKVKLPYIVLTSGAIRYRLSAIEKFLEARTVGEDGIVPEGVARHPAGPGRPPGQSKRRRINPRSRRTGRSA
jgi:hypothetical protein